MNGEKWRVWSWYEGEREFATYIPCKTWKEVQDEIELLKEWGAEYEIEKVERRNLK